MSKRPQQKRMRCGDCGEQAGGLVGGRCPRCGSIAEALRSDWAFQSTLSRSFRRPGDERLLVASVQLVRPNIWTVLAIETPGDAKTTEQVFDQHTHHSLGTFSTLPEALSTAETFAKAWLHGRVNVDECVCGPIKPVVLTKIGEAS